MDRNFSRLLQIADLKADMALADLADATAQTRRLTNMIADIDAEIALVLGKNFSTSGDQFIAIKFADMRRTRRAELMSQLARAELTRKAKLKVAQSEEGRRMAITRLRDQAS